MQPGKYRVTSLACYSLNDVVQAIQSFLCVLPYGGTNGLNSIRRQAFCRRNFAMSQLRD